MVDSIKIELVESMSDDEGFLEKPIKIAPLETNVLTKKQLQLLKKQLPYPCTSCDRRFESTGSRTSHMISTHRITSRWFRCPGCRAKYRKLESLQAHELTCLPPERMKCPQCEVTFSRRDHMQRHIRTIHENESFTCPVCHAIYKRKDHLSRHIRKSHINDIYVPEQE